MLGGEPQSAATMAFPFTHSRSSSEEPRLGTGRPILHGAGFFPASLSYCVQDRPANLSSRLI